jgi:ribosomal protein S18 acetylase RimI-like enzyme
MKIKYRPGDKDDCAKLAELISIASGGVVEYLFKDVVPGMTPVQVVADSLEKDNNPFTYKSAIVATDQNDIVGMALSYPCSYHKITNEMRRFFPEDRLEHLRQFYAAGVDDSWYLDDLCVVEGHRKKGIGQKLISLTKEKAIENRYNILSLIVFADNKLAIPVYKRTGFEIVQRVELRGNEFIHHNDGCYLMKCEMTASLQR